jgi:hypothetical protein
MMEYQYHFAKAKYRGTVDLRVYQTRILEALSEYFEDRLLDAKVHESFYEFDVAGNVTSFNVRKLGELISYKTPELEPYIITHTYKNGGISRKLFKKK